MDKRTIYSKTGKGSLEISKKTIKLASDERQTLILVDGKSNVGEIEEKLSRVSPVRLRAILDRLSELDLVREFVTKQGPDSIMPSLGGPTAMRVEELDELDFTALSAAPAGADPAQEVEQRRQAAQAAEAQAAQVRAQEAQRRQAEEESRRRADEEAARVRAAEEAQRQKEAEESRRRAEEEARRKAEEEARRKAEEEARRKAEEESRRRAEEEARRKAEEESRRRAAEEAERRQREEAEARERERREREEAERRDRARREEEARRAAAAEEKRRQEQERADAEAARLRAEEEQREREAAEHREREEAERETERRERARRDEEAKRAAIAEEKRRREQAEAQAAAAAEAREREHAETERRTNEEAARYTAALTPHLEDATPAPESLDLDFNPGGSAQTGGIESLDLKPLAGGGPDTFADTGMSANSTFEAELADETPSKKSVEKEARRELEREAKENAKAAAKAKKEAEREAKRLAQQSKVKIRRGGSGFSLGKFIAVFILLVIAGGIGYLYFMPIDKAVIESMSTARLGMQVKVGSAKFQPFPPVLMLTDVVVDDIRLPRVTAVPDPGSLAADHKIWNSIDVAGATIDLRQAEKLIAMGLREAPRGVAMTIQRVRVTGLNVTGTPVPLPAMDVNALLGADGVRQVTFSLPENKGQLQLAVDEKGWLFDFESRATAWAMGPKTAWESLRAKGVAKPEGLHFDSIALTHFGGTATGGGDLYWTGGYRFTGTLDVGGMETGGIAQAYYGASPVAGTLDGKFKVSMNAPSLARLIESTQLEGAVVVNKAAVANIDLARSAQSDGQTPGQTRFSDFTADLTLSAGRLQIKNVRANSGLLNVSGNVDISPEKSLSGVINVELGISSNRTKAALKVSGTPADPKLNK
jgi:hypothetical protein